MKIYMISISHTLQVRAVVRTFNPREEKLMEDDIKFKKNVLLRNFSRTWRVVQALIATGGFINSLFTWEKPKRSFFAFIVSCKLPGKATTTHKHQGDQGVVKTG